MDKRIANVLKEFNFLKVHRVMEAVEWKWFDQTYEEDPCPSIGDIVVAATSLCEQTLQSYDNGVNKHHTRANGGLEAYMVEDQLCLRFIVENAYDSSVE